MGGGTSLTCIRGSKKPWHIHWHLMLYSIHVYNCCQLKINKTFVGWGHHLLLQPICSVQMSCGLTFVIFFSSCAWRTMSAEICQRNRSINRSLLTGRDAKWSCSVSKKTLELLKSKMKNDKWTYFIGKTKGIDKTIDIWCREHLQEHVLGLTWAN